MAPGGRRGRRGRRNMLAGTGKKGRRSSSRNFHTGSQRRERTQVRTASGELSTEERILVSISSGSALRRSTSVAEPELSDDGRRLQAAGDVAGAAGIHGSDRSFREGERWGEGRSIWIGGSQWYHFTLFHSRSVSVVSCMSCKLSLYVVFSQL